MGFLAGCTHVTAYNPSYIRSSGIETVSRYPGKLLIYNTPLENKSEFKGGPKSVTGFAWTLDVPLGEFNKGAAGEIYGRLFSDGYENATNLNSTDADRFRAIFHSSIDDFAWRMNQAKNAGFAITPQVKMTLHLQVLSNTNAAIFDRSYESGWVDGDSYIMNFSPMETVNKAAHKTLADLMKLSVLDLDTVLKNNAYAYIAPPSSANSVKACGTGFFITDDGYFISNYHVIADAARVQILTSNGKIEAKVVKVDPVNDLALLKADGHFSLLPISSSRDIKLGSTVATVGFPDPDLQGFSPKLAKGEIAALAGIKDDVREFQISLPVQPGNSGGALVDEYGNVVGIVSAKLNASAALAVSGALPENVNYAIKSSYLLGFLESVPELSTKLSQPLAVERKFEDVVASVQEATVMVLVY